jgi:hypothetical protein
MSVDRINYCYKARLLRQGEDDVQDVRKSQDELVADMIAAEKEREGFMKYIYKYYEWFNLQWVFVRKMYCAEERILGEIDQEDNEKASWDILYNRRFMSLSGDLIGLYELLGDRGKYIANRYIENVNQTFCYNNFKENIRVNNDEVVKQLGELENEAMKRWGIFRMNKLRRDDAEDTRRTFKRITRGTSCMCEIDQTKVEEHWANNLSYKPDHMNSDEANIFLYKKKDNYLLKTEAAFWEQIRDWERKAKMIKFK